MSAPRGKIAPGRQSTPNEKPHALGRWGPKRPKLAQRTGTRTPGRVSAPLIGSTRWLFFGRAASRGAEMRATLQHCNRTWALDGLPRSDSIIYIGHDRRYAALAVSAEQKEEGRRWAVRGSARAAGSTTHADDGAHASRDAGSGGAGPDGRRSVRRRDRSVCCNCVCVSASTPGEQTSRPAPPESRRRCQASRNIIWRNAAPAAAIRRLVSTSILVSILDIVP